MVKPIKPSEVAKKKVDDTPSEVYEAFNELITQNWNGSTATVVQRDVVELIAKKLNKLTLNEIYDKGWLNVEDAYSKAGWSVQYDKPGYNESYQAYFMFSKK